MGKLHFKLMSFSFTFRDLLLPPKNILKEAGIKPGFRIFDYGCGPGSFTIAAAELAGKFGKVYALDIHPPAIKRVQKIAAKNKVTNIETICSDCATGLDNESIDVVLLYDTLHSLTNPESILEELHRILKPHSVLSFRDHHLKEGEILAKMTDKGLFRLLEKGKRTYNFSKEV